MLQILKIIVVVVSVLCVNNVSASDVQKFKEVTQADGSILVEKWEKTDEFTTEPVSGETALLSLKQKSKLWKGEHVIIEDQEIFFTSILQPSVRGITSEMKVTWSDGKYNIDSNKRHVKLDANPLIIILYIITFGILFINVLAVYQSEGHYVGVFVYNVVMLIVDPIIAVIGIVCMYLASSTFTDSFWELPFGFMGMVCYLVAAVLFPLLVTFEDGLDIGTSLNSIWSKLFVGSLSIIMGISIVIISTFIWWDAVIMDDVSFGIVVEWILYLGLCFVCLPLSILLAKSVVDSVRQKILS